MTDLSLPTPANADAAPRYTAADLAHSAGAFEISAGAAVAGTAGRRFQARLLADELAAGHRVMMRLAAKADYAIGSAAAMGDASALPFDLLAARFAGTSGRTLKPMMMLRVAAARLTSDSVIAPVPANGTLS